MSFLARIGVLSLLVGGSLAYTLAIPGQDGRILPTPLNDLFDESNKVLEGIEAGRVCNVIAEDMYVCKQVVVSPEGEVTACEGKMMIPSQSIYIKTEQNNGQYVYQRTIQDQDVDFWKENVCGQKLALVINAVCDNVEGSFITSPTPFKCFS